MISSIIETPFLIKIQPSMSEQEKKRQRIYDLLNAETKPNFLCLPYTKKRIFFFFLPKKSFLRVWRTEQKQKEGFFFTCSRYGD